MCSVFLLRQLRSSRIEAVRQNVDQVKHLKCRRGTSKLASIEVSGSVGISLYYGKENIKEKLQMYQITLTTIDDLPPYAKPR